MIRDGRKVPRQSVLEADVCIVGSGAAGISIAREFSDSSKKVILLEGGGFEGDSDTQDLYSGKQGGVPYPDYLDTSRLRYFGGTTNHWGAWCAPWKDSDFQRRDWVRGSGWPVSLSDIEPYYQKAFDLCRMQEPGEWNWEGSHWLSRFNLPKTPLTESMFELRVTQRTNPISVDRPFSFGRQYREELSKSSSLEVFLNANAVDIVTSPSGGNVEHIAVATLDGNSFTIKAKMFVLATGGIENARLLLASKGQSPNGVGNEFDNVGRYFMDHIYVPNAARFFHSTDQSSYQIFLANRLKEKNLVFNHLGTTDGMLEKHKLTDAYISLVPDFDEFYKTARDAEGVEALNEVLRDLKQGRFPENTSDKLGDMVADIDDVLVTLFRLVYHGRIPINHYNCLVRIDPTPARDSRITLIGERDSLGLPRVKLTWAINQIDKDNIRRILELFGSEVGRLNLGRVQMLFDPAKPFTDEHEIGWHHMGTTRMSESARDGVVDKNCRVHSTENLFIAGSSIFTTSGSGTPTMTICAFALRLADHLKQKLEAR